MLNKKIDIIPVDTLDNTWAIVFDNIFLYKQ